MTDNGDFGKPSLNSRDPFRYWAEAVDTGDSERSIYVKRKDLETGQVTSHYHTRVVGKLRAEGAIVALNASRHNDPSPAETLWLASEAWYVRQGIEMVLRERVSDSQRRALLDASLASFDACLAAYGL